MALRRKLRKLIPYWLISHHEETCAGCGHPHARAVSARCEACDGTFCPHCIDNVGEEVLCAQCVDVPGGGP